MDARGPSSKEIFALVDIDDTLTNTSATQLNDVLLEIMDEFKIKNICLFSSMDHKGITHDLENNATFTRPHLKETLEKKGFIVHQVITTPDVAYNHPGKYYSEKWKPTYDDIIANRKKQQTKEEKIQAINIEQEKIHAVDGGEYKEYIDNRELLIAQETHALKEEDRNDRKKLQAIYDRYAIHKGKMYEITLNNLDKISTNNPAITVGSFIMIDDKENELRNIENASKTHNYPIPLTTLQIQSNDTKKGILADIPNSDEEKNTSYIDRREIIKQRYREKFIEHFEKLEKSNELTSSQKIILKNAQAESSRQKKNRTPSIVN